MAAGLAIMDEDGNEVELDARREPSACSLLTGGLEAATVSACPELPLAGCSRRWRSSTCSTPRRRTRGGELVELADEAPTLHLYVVDLASDCEHPAGATRCSTNGSTSVERAGPHVRR